MSENPNETPLYDELERRRRRREHPFVDDDAVGELEPLLGTPEPENVPQVGQATVEQPQAEGYALQPGEELGVETEHPGTGEPMLETPVLAARVVVSAMPSTTAGEQTVVSEVYPRLVGPRAAPVATWVRTLPDPAPLCTEQGLEHDLAFATAAGQLATHGGPPPWQVALHVCSRCPYAETDDADEPPPEVREPTAAALEAAARIAESREQNPARAAELRARKDRGGRAVEREGRGQ